MGISQRQLVQECFDGDRKRECTYCPGHHTKSGICCFGRRYEENDEQCLSCPHTEACESATFQHLTHEDEQYRGERPRRVTTIPNRPARPMSNSRRPSVSRQTAQHGDLIAAPRPAKGVVEPVRFHDQGFFAQMGLHALWGSMEGAFEMLLGFLRNRRPD